MKAIFWVSALSLTAFQRVQAAPTAKPVLEVRGDIAKPLTLTLSQLEKLAPAQTIQTTLKGQPFTARGIPLWSIVNAAAPRFDPKTKHSEARFVVLASGKDGYQSSFSWSELSPALANEKVFLIWEASGKPLSEREGPFRLVVPGDKKPMRWVFNLVSLQIYDAKRLAVAK